MAPSKLVVVGNISGQLRDVFGKLATLHSKNAFAFALVVGNIFANPETASAKEEEEVSSLIQGKIEIPLPTYFALGSHALPAAVIERLDANDNEVCHNLFFLGKRSTTKTSEGIRIVTLGGLLDPELTVGASKDKYPPYYCEGDAKTLRGANSADILITSQWPDHMATGSKVALPSADQPITQLQCLFDLCVALKPRYHFSTSGELFYEREPFFHTQDQDSDPGYHITRFISLASYGNPNRAKWIYAFSLDPTAAPPTMIPPGTTASPYAFQPKKRAALPDQNSFRFDSGGPHRTHHGRPSKRHKTPPAPGECFFCLSNPNLATHLITSIGDNAYLTTAKGPLGISSTFPQLGFPCHILIIPLTHAPTLSAITDVESRETTYGEMQRFRSRLNSMLDAKSDGTLGSVTWEVSRAGGVHTHWQYLPVSADMVRKGLVEAAFKVQAENDKYPHLIKKDAKDGAEVDTDFFRLEIWQPSVKSDDGAAHEDGKDKSFMLPLDPSFRFDLQFGRVVMAKLLGLENRAHWQDCEQSHEDEVKDVEAFKKAFEEWDFTLDE